MMGNGILDTRRARVWRVMLVVTPVLFLLLGQLTAVEAVDFQYEYDALGRLISVIDSNGNVVFYTYDEVGNLISLIRTTTTAPPVVIDDTVNQGDTVEVVIRGPNLLPGTPTVSQTGVSLVSFIATATEVRITLDVAPSASPGPLTVTLTTAAGDVAILLTVIGPRPLLSFIFPGQGPASGGTTVTLSGSNLTPDTTVTFGTQPATGATFVDAETLTAISPAGTVGVAVDVTVQNGNGSSTLSGGFTYSFPFRIPGALSIETGETGTLTVTLVEPVAIDMTLSLLSTDPTVATLQGSATIPAGANTVDIPVTAGAEGISTVTVSIGAAGLLMPVYVIPPFTPDNDPETGERATFVALPVGLFTPPAATLPAVVLAGGGAKTITVLLSQPAPPGGLSVILIVSDSTIAAVPSSVFIAAGQQAVSFEVTALAAGETTIMLAAGNEVIQLRVLVDQPLRNTGVGVAPPVGVFVGPNLTQGVTLAPPVGVFVGPNLTQGVTLAPIVGVEVLP